MRPFGFDHVEPVRVLPSREEGAAQDAQFLLARDALNMIRGNRAQREMQSNEAAARVVDLVEPVGVDEARCVVVRVRADGVEKSFFVGHGPLPSGRGYPALTPR